MHGLGISLTHLKDGLSRWKVHVLVQLCTFALFPLIWMATDSVASGLWRDNGVGMLTLALFGTGLILLLGLSTWLVRRQAFPVENEIAAVFCGSKKTMASGVPMAKLLFGAHPSLGLILLPIMLYHQLQLFVCSILANRYAQRRVASSQP